MPYPWTAGKSSPWSGEYPHDEAGSSSSPMRGEGHLGIDDDKVIDLRTSGEVGLKEGHRWGLDFVIYPSLLD